MPLFCQGADIFDGIDYCDGLFANKKNMHWFLSIRNRLIRNRVLLATATLLLSVISSVAFLLLVTLSPKNLSCIQVAMLEKKNYFSILQTGYPSNFTYIGKGPPRVCRIGHQAGSRPWRYYYYITCWNQIHGHLYRFVYGPK